MHSSARRNFAALFGIALMAMVLSVRGASAQRAAPAGELTGERIYSQPSLSGQPTRGVAC